ncbi:repetitive organellar protein [Galleria mellonella]|uniref:Repetitive organellar protein n=1 Tax=Galleria mellonella TaxID=7137 RepID=A0ABM3MT15_GALME|nr:repetitive organellar protein [Galleria mellonella]
MLTKTFVVMSETDDTDVLLLIPPNFFLVESSISDDSLLESSRTVVHKPVSCTAQVLDKLADRVHSLESRLESLEVCTSDTVSKNSNRNSWDTGDSIEHSLDRRCFTFPRRRRRKTGKREKKRELSLTSLDSFWTRNKVPLLNLKSTSEVSSTKKAFIDDTPSMDGDISSIVSTPSKKNDKLLLNEIDEFLTKVEAYEGPDSKFKEQETLSPEHVIKATGDYISHSIESKSNDDIKLPSGRVMTSNVLDKYIYLVKSNSGSSVSQSDKPLPPSSYKNQYNEDSTIRPADDSKESVTKMDPKSLSIRRLNFSEKDVQPTSTPKKPAQSTSYTDSFRPSSNKIYDRASKVLEQYKINNSRNTQNSAPESYLQSPKKETFKMPQMRPYISDNKETLKLAAYQNKLIETIDTDLLSLSELWGYGADKGDRTERGDSLKLEEEKLKREHCESMIQQLQKKILDQQEKLAVALKVDRAKDAAITKLREAWLKITSSLDKVEERHKTGLEKMMREVESFKMVASDAQKKTNHFESELYKALDLAHDYQEKCKQLTSEQKELQDRMERTLASKQDIISSKEKEIEVLKENYETVMRLNKQSTDCAKNLEDALEKEKSDHNVTRIKVNELTRKLQTIDEETSLALQERSLLKDKVNEERSRGNLLERQLCDKENQNSELLKKCDTLDNEVKMLRKHLELQKNELKVHYQKQLEDAVLAKLQEFQQQLDHAEREMENDARSKENAIVDTFNKQMTRIEEQHKLEVKVLEEKQKEEIKLYRLQLAQASEKISLLEGKLESHRRRRGQIASQLHGVMEAQWRQALRILACPPAALADLDLSLAPSAPDTVATPVVPEFPPSKPPLPPHRGRRGEALNFDGLSDNELRQYVKLLLTKPANLDGSGDCLLPQRDHDEPTSDRPERSDQLDQFDRHDKKDKSRRSINNAKPPWKA